MLIKKIGWNESTVSHIARHGVSPEEVEWACFNASPYILRSRRHRYIALGQTESRRYLTIVFKYLGRNQAEIITARAMSKAEKRLYQRR